MCDLKFVSKVLGLLTDNLVVPSMFIDEGTRTKAFDRAVRFLKEVHQDGAEVSNNAVSKHHEL